MAAAIPDNESSDCIVIDSGTGYVKAGWAGEDAPRVIIPTAIAENGQHYAKDNRLYGYEALHAMSNNTNSDDDMTLITPVTRGEITDLKWMKKIWKRVFRELRVDAEDYPVLLTTVPLSNKDPREAQADRKKVAEMMFNDFRVKSLSMFNSAVLSLFSTGRTRGLVLELGEGVTHAVPVFEGYALPHAINRMNLAGADLTERMLHLLNQKEKKFTDNHAYIVRDIKEKLAIVSPDPNFDPSNPPQSGEASYELPDGNVIKIDAQTRYSTPEILFKPKLLNDNLQMGIHNMVCDSINKCDEYLQKDLWANIVVSGGTSMLNGLLERLSAELAHQAPSEKPQVVCDSQRKHASWIGGSMVASLPTFNILKITKQEFDENSLIVEKKLFG